MIAFGCSITVDETFRAYAEPGLRRAAEPDSVVLARQAAESIYRTYNQMCDELAARDDLEALVVVHQDAEIVDPDFCAKVRRALADPDVAIVGAVGAVGAQGIAWWEGRVTWGSFLRCHRLLADGPVPAFLSNGGPALEVGAEVETLNGFVMALSPWAVRNLRFDESLGLAMYGHDYDICRQAREAGRKVITADLHVRHHRDVILVPHPEAWLEAHMRVAEKWDPASPDTDWKARARRSEAEAGVARLAGASKLLFAYSSAGEQQEAFSRVTDTLSWRATRPLRELNLWRRRRRGGEVAGAPERLEAPAAAVPAAPQKPQT